MIKNLKEIENSLSVLELIRSNWFVISYEYNQQILTGVVDFSTFDSKIKTKTSCLKEKMLSLLCLTDVSQERFIQMQVSY